MENHVENYVETGGIYELEGLSMNTPHVGPQRLQITRTCSGLFGAQGLKTYVEPEEDPAQHGLDKALIRIIQRLYRHQLGMLEELP